MKAGFEIFFIVIFPILVLCSCSGDDAVELSNEELLQVSLLGIIGEDQSVKESSIDCLGNLANTEKKDIALDLRM